jgi:hypothetical protein
MICKKCTAVQHHFFLGIRIIGLISRKSGYEHYLGSWLIMGLRI